MVNPKIMCQNHLLGEHVEHHMFVGSLKRKISMSGYIKNNLLEILSLKERHDLIAEEINKRGGNHKSPLLITTSLYSYLPKEEIEYTINRQMALNDLISRCPLCYNNYYKK